MRLAVFLLLILIVPCFGDEALLRDGKRISGTLTLEKAGQLRFTPDNVKTPVALAGVSSVRLSSGPAPIFRAGPAHVLHLAGGQHLAGSFLGIERDNLLFRTAWANRLVVPRRSVVALTHLPGWRTIFHDDFAGKLTGWAGQGSPTAGKGGVVFDRAGQSLSWKAPFGVTSGRVGVNFRGEKPSGARWVLEVSFAGKPAARVVRIVLAGMSEKEVDPGGLAGTAQATKQVPGWQRVVVAFSPGSLRVTRDDSVLWYSLEQGPGGALRQVRLACEPVGEMKAQGSIECSDFCVEQAVSEKQRPPGQPGKDELWLASGDQLFGEVTRADGRGVTIKGRFRQRFYAWSRLRGWYCKQGLKPTAPLGGPMVWLGLASGLQAESDVLTGAFIGLSEKQITLKHAVLGEVTIPRGHVRALRP